MVDRVTGWGVWLVLWGMLGAPMHAWAGRNVQMPAGSYPITAVVNGEGATFHVTVQ